MAGKLSRDHKSAVAYLVALGDGPVAIQRKLQAGLSLPAGVDLPAVEVTEAAVRYQLDQPAVRDMVDAWRRDLYGDVYDAPLAYAGERMRKLAADYEELGCQLEHVRSQLDQLGPGGKGAVSRRAEMRDIIAARQAVLRDIGQLVREATPDVSVTQRSAPGAAGGPAEVTASGKLAASALSQLAQDLAAARQAGIIELPEPGAADESEEPAPSTQLDDPGPPP